MTLAAGGHQGRARLTAEAACPPAVGHAMQRPMRASGSQGDSNPQYQRSVLDYYLEVG